MDRACKSKFAGSHAAKVGTAVANAIVADASIGHEPINNVRSDAIADGHAVLTNYAANASTAETTWVATSCSHAIAAWLADAPKLVADEAHVTRPITYATRSAAHVTYAADVADATRTRSVATTLNDAAVATADDDLTLAVDADAAAVDDAATDADATTIDDEIAVYTGADVIG